MKLFQTKRDEQDDLNYEGNAVVRMMSYMKLPGTCGILFFLVIIITVLELYKPILIGDAIDNFITGDYAPGEMVQERFTGILWAAAQYVGVLLLLFVCNRIQYVLLQSTGQKIIY